LGVTLLQRFTLRQPVLCLSENPNFRELAEFVDPADARVRAATQKVPVKNNLPGKD
jgi:hypothetical protein